MSTLLPSRGAVWVCALDSGATRRHDASLVLLDCAEPASLLDQSQTLKLSAVISVTSDHSEPLRVCPPPPQCLCHCPNGTLVSTVALSMSLLISRAEFPVYTSAAPKGAQAA